MQPENILHGTIFLKFCLEMIDSYLQCGIFEVYAEVYFRPEVLKRNVWP